MAFRIGFLNHTGYVLPYLLSTSVLAFVSFYVMLFRPSAKVPAANPEVEIANKIRKAKNMQAFCSIFGYSHEEHQVTTEDGYILTLHRLLPKGASGPESLKGRPVVYLQHGLLTNSELFMSVTAPEKCLPLVLLESGYDIWLGNNRYVSMHTTLPTSAINSCSGGTNIREGTQASPAKRPISGYRYFFRHIRKTRADISSNQDYCIDDFVQYDIPNSISFIIKQTGSSKISYIGFSQGSAQGFGALSVNSTLSQSLNMFIALAPIMRPAGYPSPRLDSIVKKKLVSHFTNWIYSDVRTLLVQISCTRFLAEKPCVLGLLSCKPIYRHFLLQRSLIGP